MANKLKTLRDAFRRAPSIDAVIQLAKQFAYDHGDMEPRAALNFVRRIGYRKETALRVIDALTRCHGVESFKTKDGYWDYVNTGDSYAETVLLSPGGKFFVESIGDRLERSTHMRGAE